MWIPYDPMPGFSRLSGEPPVWCNGNRHVRFVDEQEKSSFCDCPIEKVLKK